MEKNAEYEDQNVNTINIKKGENLTNKGENYKINIDLIRFQTAPVYKLSIKGTEEQNNLITKEFDEMVKQIVDSNDTSFLKGEINLIEFLIKKYSNLESCDVETIEELCMKVKEDFGMLNEFGKYLPKIKILNLSGSGIKSILDIGTSFVNLISLNISHCNVSDLSGIVCFRNLEKIDCSFNLIYDLLDLEMCQSLIEINLKNNEIEEEDNIIFLSNLKLLKYLNLSNNPIQLNKKYDKLIQDYLSHITLIEQ